MKVTITKDVNKAKSYVLNSSKHNIPINGLVQRLRDKYGLGYREAVLLLNELGIIRL